MLNHSPTQCKVKICGLTNLSDARAAYQAGADLLGFIFYPKSPRYVAPETVAQIAQSIRASARQDQRTVYLVGVFVNHAVAEVRAVMTQSRLDFAQLHGGESVSMLEALDTVAYKALRPATNAEAQAQAAMYAYSSVHTDGTKADDANADEENAAVAPATVKPAWMLDAYDPDAYGGTGKKADWLMAASLAKKHPGLLLAGGLTAENVAQAIRTVRPWGVDVASGVESQPGQKDHKLVRAFVEAAKSAHV